MAKLKFCIIAIAYWLASCAPKPYYEMNTTNIDYAKIIATYGVFITESNSVNFDYDQCYRAIRIFNNRNS